MSPEPRQRLVAGLWCGDVLARLPDFVDGTLPAEEAAAARAHLAGCDWCERFGGRYGALVGQLRELPAPPIPDELARRLDERLDRLRDP